MRRPRPAAVAAALAAAAGTLATVAAPAAVAQSRGGAVAPKPYFDSRKQSQQPPARRVANARGVVSGPSSGGAAAVAERFVERRRGALGLDRSDVSTLRPTGVDAIPGGARAARFRQYVGDIPSFDGGVDVFLDGAGRVLTAHGSAQPDLSVDSRAPRLSAADAFRALMRNVGAVRPFRVSSGPQGARRSTAFSTGDTATLAVFADGGNGRLAWQIDYRAAPLAHYTALIDAENGRLLYRANSVRTAANDALVWENHPGAGAANGGTAVTRNLTPYLNPGTRVLSGPYARVWSDVNDDYDPLTPDLPVTPGEPDSGEEINRKGDGTYVFPFVTFNTNNSGCSAALPCSWNFRTGPSTTTPKSWQTNRSQNGVQAFWFVNRFRDRLAAAPISFSVADGNFDNGDRVAVNTDDGAATFADGGPDDDHVDNAYMDTPPDGNSPTMAMFLFSNDIGPGAGLFRDVNGGDDASIVYHEFTHGLSSRLITLPGGEQALNSDQSGAMGEGWSDFYAKDFLVEQFPGEDTSAPGEVDMGEYTDVVPHSIRYEPLDCPVGADASVCPGSTASSGGGDAGSGGFTYGDFGRIFRDPNTHQLGPEVHADGEIWAQTLWDLRGAVGSSVARAIVTQGMRLSPPEPTYLDERDAIVQADRQLFPNGDHSGAIWRVFAARGMGWDASDTTTTDGFKRPPTALLAATPTQVQPGGTVTFDASGSADPDGTLAPGYDWDFDGNGTIERTTSSPTTSFTYRNAGTFKPTVTVHDDEGQSDAASKVVRVTAPPPPQPTPTPTPSPTPTPTPTVTPGPVNPAAPAISISRAGSKGRIRFTVRCDSACSGTAKLTISRKLAKKLGLGLGRKRTIASRKVRLSAAGTKRYTVRLSRKVVRAMRREGIRRIATKLRVSVLDAESQRLTRARSPRIRR